MSDDKSENWVFITPVFGVELTNAVKDELRIKRALLISKNKLPRIRKRLGISKKFSELKNTALGESIDDILKSSNTFAIVRHTANSKKAINDCRKIVQDELSILSASQLGWSKRRNNYNITVKENKSFSILQNILISTENDRRRTRHQLAQKVGDLSLASSWKSFCKQNFFFNLLKIINKKTSVSESWRKDIERVSILIGQSQNSDDIAHAFMWNMIALEVLLTRQGDKYTDVLPQRISAFLGWFRFWGTGKFSEKINEIYGKRCAFVHDGRKENITVPDLLFTDDILFNILTNLLAHTKLLSSKDDVINFARKVEAEQLLRIKTKVRPKTLRFISRSYTEEDFQNI